MNKNRIKIIIVIIILFLTLIICGCKDSGDDDDSTDGNSTLASLEISVGTLSPVFSSETLLYTDAVSKTVDSITVTPTSSSATSTITVNGVNVASGQSSDPINLTLGENGITIIVTAEDSSSTTYTIMVSKEFVIESHPSSGSEEAYEVAVDSDYIYIVGSDSAAGYYRLEKRNKSNGELENNFDTDGVLILESGIFAKSIAVDNNYIYLAGHDNSLGSANSQLRIEKRDITTGALVTAFDTDGIVVSNPSVGIDRFDDVAIDSNYIYTAGYDHSHVNSQMRIEKRNITTGALVTAFDTDGIVESDRTRGEDVATAIAIDSNYIYIAGYDESPGNIQWRIEKRNITTGALIAAFDTDGVVVSNPSAGDDIVTSTAIDSDYIYIAGYDESPGNIQWRIEKRDITTGALVTAFDTDGIVESNPSSSYDYANDMVIDSSSIYIVGRDNAAGDSEWRIEKRNITSGALVSAFDSDGVIQSNPSSMLDYADAVAIDSDHIYVAGSDYFDIGGSTFYQQWKIDKRDITTGSLY
jgi:hypothetical protein